MSKVINKTLSNKVELKQDSNAGTLKFMVLGVPYNGPDYMNGKDFHGDYFKSTTDYGDDLNVKTVYATLDHAVSDDPKTGKLIMHPMKSVIGTATFIKDDELGRWYEIEVTRGNQYQDMLMKLQAKNLLYASSQAIPTTVTKSEDGGIDSWVVSEVALTTHAANPLAIVEVMKSVELPEFNEVITAYSKSVDTDEGEGTIAVLTNEEEGTLTDLVDELFNDTEGSDNEETPNEDVDSGESEESQKSTTFKDFQTELTSWLDSLSDEPFAKATTFKEFRAKLTTWLDMYVNTYGVVEMSDDEEAADVADLIAQMLEASKALNIENEALKSQSEELKAQNIEILKSLTNLDKGIRHYAVTTAKYLKREVGAEAYKMAELSEPEKDAEEILTHKSSSLASSIPEHAPGG